MSGLGVMLLIVELSVVCGPAGWDEAEAHFRAQGDGADGTVQVSVQKLMQTEPNVECTGDSMKLNVKGSFSTPGALFVVDRGKHLCVCVCVRVCVFSV